MSSPHDARENSSHDTTGKEISRRTREWSSGRIQAPADVGGGGAEEHGDRPRGEERGRGDEREEHVLDHVDPEQRRVMPLDAQSSANSTASTPSARPADRERGTGFAGWARFTDLTPSHHSTSATIAGSQTRGSPDQPRSRLAASGGTSGTVPPWARATGASAGARAAAAPSRRAAAGPSTGPPAPGAARDPWAAAARHDAPDARHDAADALHERRDGCRGAPDGTGARIDGVHGPILTGIAPCGTL